LIEIHLPASASVHSDLTRLFQALSLLGSAPLVPALLDALDWYMRQPTNLNSRFVDTLRPPASHPSHILIRCLFVWCVSAVLEAALRLFCLLLKAPTWRSLIDHMSLKRNLLMQACMISTLNPFEQHTFFGTHCSFFEVPIFSGAFFPQLCFNPNATACGIHPAIVRCHYDFRLFNNIV
jgi:hypothetical protein